MPSWIDESLYPDCDAPETIESLAARVDFLARLCGAWDFGILPYPETIAEIKRPEWREAVDECRKLTSATYHLVREWHGLPELPYLGRLRPEILADPNLAFV